MRTTPDFLTVSMYNRYLFSDMVLEQTRYISKWKLLRHVPIDFADFGIAYKTGAGPLINYRLFAHLFSLTFREMKQPANMKHFCSNDPIQPVQRPPKAAMSITHHTSDTTVESHQQLIPTGFCRCQHPLKSDVFICVYTLCHFHTVTEHIKGFARFLKSSLIKANEPVTFFKKKEHSVPKFHYISKEFKSSTPLRSLM